MMVDKGFIFWETLYHSISSIGHDEKRFGGHSVAEISERQLPRAVAAGVKIALDRASAHFHTEARPKNSSTW